MFILWDGSGNRIEDALPRESPANLLQVDKSTLNFDLDVVVTRVASMKKGSSVATVHELGRNHYIVLDVALSTERHYIVRISNHATDASFRFSRQKLEQECSMMEWISSVTTIPIPKVYICDLISEPPFMISEKCDGDTVTDVFGLLSEEAKLRSIDSYASASLQMFRVWTPGKIGSIVAHKPALTSQSLQDPTVFIGPCLGPTMDNQPDAPFSDITQYFGWLFARKSTISATTQEPADLDEALQGLKSLQEYTMTLCRTFDATHLRLVPTHEDLNTHNILCDRSGEITGLIDWEFHSIKPAVLATSYPPWTSHSGVHCLVDTLQQDSRFSSYFLCSSSEGERLREYYRSIVLKSDPEYYDALTHKQGDVCRQIELWLLDDRTDPGCREMRKWLGSKLGKDI